MIDFSGPNNALQLFGIALIGATPENGRKLLLMLAFITVVLLLAWMLRRIASFIAHRRIAFWARQIINIVSAGLVLLGIISIWFDDPSRLATAAGLVTAGIAFALQRVITAFAGYLVILRGKTFNVGDRIVMGGVRGDVVALSFMQTTILEMGEPPPVQSAPPAVWVRARQYTGRVVAVSNAQVFDEPVFNYTRELPFIWEEMLVPVRYGDDRRRAERILLEVAEKHTADMSGLGEEALAELRRRYDLPANDAQPHVYFRLTDNWLELSLRFLAPAHGVRGLKDAMSREILDRFDEAGLTIASATYEIVGLPPLKIEDGSLGRPKS